MAKSATQAVRQQSENQGNSRQGRKDDAMQPFEDARTYMMDYAKEQPEMAALICFGVGFVLGWKLKPW